jgi:hypothetical protein
MTYRIAVRSVLSLGLLLVACGSEDTEPQALVDDAEVEVVPEVPSRDTPQEAESWIEYTVTGDFSAEGRDAESIICSETDEGWAIAARGAWYMDMTFDGVGPGERTGEIQVAVPEGTAGAPGSAFARRMKTTGTVTITEAGTGAMGMPKIEMTFAATGLTNDDGQSVDLSGKALCVVF